MEEVLSSADQPFPGATWILLAYCHLLWEPPLLYLLFDKETEAPEGKLPTQVPTNGPGVVDPQRGKPCP